MTPSMQELVDACDEAKTGYELAKREESRARTRATTALNNLNAAQKALDAALDKIRDAAPFESEWKRSERRKCEVKA